MGTNKRAMATPPPKRQKTPPVACQNGANVDGVKTIEDLANHGAMDVITRMLGMDASTLRCSSRRLSQCSLPHVARIAAAVIRGRPSVPLSMHKACRQPKHACSEDKGHVWTEERFRATSAWREYWASLVILLEQAPINVLLDAHAIALDEHCKAHERHLRDPTAWQRCERMHKSRKVLQFVIQDRLWDVCCSKDVYRDARGAVVTDYMSHVQARDTVKRMLEDTHTSHGPNAFYFTKYGWLKFTPFLLAAERQNLPLVKYLYDVFPNAATVDATSQAGNNAYALCKAWLERTRHTPKMIRESELLHYLIDSGMSQQPHVDEYASIAAQAPAVTGV